MIDYIMQHLWQLWAAVALICLILELTAGDFFIICFAIGAVPAAIVAAIGAGTYYQIVVFVVVTLVSLFYVRICIKAKTNVLVMLMRCWADRVGW